MKKAGELLSVFFTKETLDEAEGYTKLFRSWEEVVNDLHIQSAGDYSRIVRFERNILLIEADHPGWIQILQSKQRDLLLEFQSRFPDFSIKEISFRLSRTPIFKPAEKELEAEAKAEKEAVAVEKTSVETDIANEPLYERIRDDDFRESLKRLEKSIILKNGGS